MWGGLLLGQSVDEIFFVVRGHVTSEPNDPIVIDADGRIGRIVYYIGQLYTWMQPWEN